MEKEGITTGIQRLDRLIGGLRPGDNVVWEIDRGAPIEAFIASFLREVSAGGGAAIFVAFNQSPQATFRRYGDLIPLDRLFLLDCFTSGRGHDDHVFADFYKEEKPHFNATRISNPTDPAEIRSAVKKVDRHLSGNVCYVFDSITGMTELWGDERQALDFFGYMCPRLYDLDTVAYWTLEKQAHTSDFSARIHHITQVVIELSASGGRSAATLRKAQGRSAPELGVPKYFHAVGRHVQFEPEAREEREIAILNEVSGAIAGSLVLDEVFERTMEILARDLHLVRGTLVLLDRASNELRIAAAHGLTPGEKERGKYKLGEGVTGKVVATGKPIVVADIGKDPRFLDRTGARKEKMVRPLSFICVPLRSEDETLGAMSVDRDCVDEETLSKDLRLLRIVGSMISQAIKIHRMVMMDEEELRAENVLLRTRLKSKFKFDNIVGASGAMEDVLTTVELVAKSTACVLIQGETGTGKELIANAIHYNSPRANGPFVKVNCSALPESLLESELFGHVRGAFTGAIEDRKGRFEVADGGTIFLDEVGTMTPPLQVKLLGVLQEHEFEPVGSSKPMKVDVRVIAATNLNLEEEVKQGRFRADLFYRLNVVPIYIPPLRERREGIPLLVEHFLEKYGRENGKNITRTSREVLDLLMAYPWPGNVRELEHCIERAIVLSTTDSISIDLLPISITSFKHRAGYGHVDHPDRLLAQLIEDCGGKFGRTHARVIARVERALIQRVLADNNYNQSRTALELGMARNTLHKKIRALRIEIPSRSGP